MKTNFAVTEHFAGRSHAAGLRAQEWHKAPLLRPNQERRQWQRLLPAAIKGVILSAVIGIIVAAAFSNQYLEAREMLLKTAWGRLWLVAGAVFLVVNIAALIWRVVLFLGYSPVPGCCDEELPACTVIVPAFNEGRQVLLTLESLARSDYPAEKLQLIAVDDGSVDDTWHWIEQAKASLGDILTTIRQPVNRGKRHALYEGILKSRGEVLVTVDSDSTVEKDTLRNLVSPFVRDPKVGAVAGNVRVLNKDSGLIPRMLDVSFVFSFEFIRAGQSRVNAVLCTPGALSAYRREIVMRVLNQWLHQTFCGRPANIGEDRAMTNLILESGSHVVFQRNAKVYTEVPTHYNKLTKMFLRWARSNIRETIVMSRFAFRRFREGSMAGARINLLLGWMTLTKAQLVLAATWVLVLTHPMLFGLNLIAGIVVSSSFSGILYALRYRTSDALWAYAYGFFWFLSLFWITPYALMTPHQTAWLTRQAACSSPSPAQVAGKRRVRNFRRNDSRIGEIPGLLLLRDAGNQSQASGGLRRA